VNVTPFAPVPMLRLSSSLPTASPELPAAEETFDELPARRSRKAEETSELDVGDAGPADEPVPVATVPVAGAATVPPDEPGVSGAAVCGAGSPVVLDVGATGVVPAVAGDVVALGAAGVTTVVLGAAGTVVVTTDCIIDSDTFELPDPTSGTVVGGAGATVVAGAAVGGGVACATVDGVLADVP